MNSLKYLSEAAVDKVKIYCCVVRVDWELYPNDIQQINSMKNFEIY